MQIFISKGVINPCCPYNNNPFEGDVHAMLNEFTVRHPATKYALMSLEKNWPVHVFP